MQVEEYCPKDVDVKYKLCDSRGFDDPNISNHLLWKQLLQEMSSKNKGVDLQNHGIGAIIIPIMVPVSLRIEAASTNLVFEALMSLTLTNKYRLLNHQKAPFIPKILIVFNNVRPEEDTPEFSR